MNDYPTSLIETADRFRLSPETIWNLSLSFSDFLRPKLSDDGLVIYSLAQREIITKIIGLRKQGWLDDEIIARLNSNDDKEIDEKKCVETNHDTSTSSVKNLSKQVKKLWQQIDMLKYEFESLNQKLTEPFPNTQSEEATTITSKAA